MPVVVDLPAAKASFIRDLLRQKKSRDAERAFVIEGGKPIMELLRGQAQSLRMIVVTPAYLERSEPTLRQTLERGAAPVYRCRERVFDQLSDVRTAPGILAVVRQPEWGQDAFFKRPQVFGIYGECLQDPANVGAIIRTAAAFSVDALWLTADSADVFNPKVVRATAGAILKLPIFTIKDAGTAIELFARHGCALLAADPSRKRSQAIREITSIPVRAILAFGNESRGLAEATLKQAALRFHIPVSRTVESLNVAASAAVALFYFSALPRQG